MTKPTPKEQDRRIAEHEVRINERWQERAYNAAALKAAGGLASDKTLRDHFAGQAMAASVAAGDGSYACGIADVAYFLADAMLEARKTTGEGEA
jgi:hypothetical protein